MINMNKQTISLRDYENGRTSAVEIKLGRNIYLLDIYADTHTAIIDMYNRTTGGKYSRNAKMHTVTVNRYAVLNKEFFLNFIEIVHAQQLKAKYRSQFGIEI